MSDGSKRVLAKTSGGQSYSKHGLNPESTPLHRLELVTSPLANQVPAMPD